MKKLLQQIFRPMFIWVADRFGAAPQQEVVFRSLSKLYRSLLSGKTRKGPLIDINTTTDHFIIFSDQHKGNKDSGDDFRNNEANYIAALKYYQQGCFFFINLGDAEELWKYTADKVIANNTASLQAEAAFQVDNKYYRTFGNHDLLWKNKLDVMLHFKGIFKLPLPVYEGLVLRTRVTGKSDVPETLHIFLTHGHQGDKMSDNNEISTWVIAHIWSPIQRSLGININTPANDFYLRDKHNNMMYEWSKRKKNTLLVTGHTHKPVFASGKYSGKTAHKIDPDHSVDSLLPTYFNTGCCCYNDGDITGIEIANDVIRLIKWHGQDGQPVRTVLEESALQQLMQDMQALKKNDR